MTSPSDLMLATALLTAMFFGLFIYLAPDEDDDG